MHLFNTAGDQILEEIWKKEQREGRKQNMFFGKAMEFRAQMEERALGRMCPL